MTERPPRREILSNPFFVILLVTSTMFVLTALAYLVSPYVVAPRPGLPPRGEGSIALALWLDRHAPLALGVEFAVMLASGVLAMATDRWFSPRSRSREARRPE
jgi:hypothetical protein